MGSITVENEEHWHELRKANIGSSDVAALFGVSQWKTAWQLWMEKAGRLAEQDFSDNVSIQGGKHLETGIATWAGEKFEMQLRKVHRYMTHDSIPGLGASLDFEEMGSGNLLPVEIKWSLWGDGWEFEGDDIIDAPAAYMLQVQHQLMCMPNAPYASLIALVRSGLKRMIIEPRPKIQAAIEERVREFWGSIERGEEPEPDLNVDYEAIMRLYGLAKEVEPVPDYQDNPRVVELCNQFVDLQKKAKDIEEDQRETKSELIMIVGEAKKATCGDFNISAPQIAPTADKVVTEKQVGKAANGIIVTDDMVGKAQIKGRKGYRKIGVTKPKKKESK